MIGTVCRSDYIRFYHLRSYDRINGPYNSFIKKMEEKSGVTFHQAQVALARKWIGKIDENWVQDTGMLFGKVCFYIQN